MGVRLFFGVLGLAFQVSELPLKQQPLLLELYVTRQMSMLSMLSVLRMLRMLGECVGRSRASQQKHLVFEVVI